MSEAPLQLTPVSLDENTLAFYLDVPGSQVVMLQAIFETHEGVGTVRTIDIRRSLICVLTTISQAPDCLALLDAIRHTIPWRPAAIPEDRHGDQFLGYAKKGR